MKSSQTQAKQWRPSTKVFFHTRQRHPQIIAHVKLRAWVTAFPKDGTRMGEVAPSGPRKLSENQLLKSDVIHPHCPHLGTYYRDSWIHHRLVPGGPNKILSILLGFTTILCVCHNGCTYDQKWLRLPWFAFRTTTYTK